MRQDTTTYNGGSWQTVNGIVEPTAPSENLLPNGAEKMLSEKPAVTNWYPMKALSDSLLKAREDSLIRAANDSAAREHPAFGILLNSPYLEETEPVAKNPSGTEGLSWVYVGFAVLFCVLCLKFKKNTRYILALVSDLTQVRVRQNAFDDTVKETSFLLLLNLLWVCSVGVLLWKTVLYMVPNDAAGSFSIPDRPGLGIALCCGVTAVYVILMTLAYTIIGNVFSDSRMTGMWVKGSLASQGLEAGFMFILALLSLCYTPWISNILLVSAGVFVIGKIFFICKGFRIFFQQSSSWLLFLYYLCSLEIIPLSLTYLATLQLCSIAL